MARHYPVGLLFGVLIPALAGLVSCKPQPLHVLSPITIAVQSEDSGLSQVASGLKGMLLTQAPSAQSWYQRYRKETAAGIAADLYLADWGQDLFRMAIEGGLATGDAYWRRGMYGGQAPAWLGQLTVGPKTGFLPTTAYVWGLFLNADLASRYMKAPPGTFEALESLFEAVRKEGLPPIALGSAYGWPGAAWFQLLDLRLNGAAAVAERYGGKRPFNDAGAVAALTTLAAWRDKGWLSPDAAGADFRESLRLVENGEALCVLAGTFAFERFMDSRNVRFLAVPHLEGSKNRGEIVGLDGFVLPAGLGQEKIETAYAFADAYLKAGSPSSLAAPYKVPLAAVYRKSTEAPIIEPKLNEIQRAQVSALAEANEVVPAFDQAVSPQGLQDSLSLWGVFFEPGGEAAGEFADKLQRALGMPADKGASR